MMLARNTDPHTSKAAAAIAPVKFKEIILDELKKRPGTFEELAERTGLRPDQVWRRLSDLNKENRAFPSAETKPGASGRQQRVWRSW